MCLQSEITEKLVDVLTFVCENPLVFVSETDIHSIVFSELMNIKELHYKEGLQETQCTIGKNNVGVPSDRMYKTMLIHKEYGHHNINYARSDIAIFSPESVSEIKDPLNLRKVKNKSGYLSPDFIIEFGTEKAANSAEVFQNHLTKDIEKLKNSKKQGFLIHIQRNCITDANKKKNKEKYEEYSKIFNQKYSEVCDANLPIKMLYILLEVGNAKRTIFKEGKYKFFNGESVGAENKQSIRQTIKKILE